MTLEKLGSLRDDGLRLPEVGPWSETKYRLIANYAQIFATGMKAKWDVRAYVDLFAGAGRARIRGTDQIVATSAMLALRVRDPFDQYVFCERSPEMAAALSTRVRRDHADSCALVIEGDCNSVVDQILDAVPRGARGRTVLCFCVVDPFAVGDLQFATIERLAERFIDFLVLVPSGTDANRNQERLRKSDHSILDTFLGHSEWWSRWEDRSRSGIGISFGTFVVEEFGRSMERLRYRYDGPGEEVVVRDGGRVLYHLSLYSRNPLGQKFWSQAARYSNDQLGLDFD